MDIKTFESGLTHGIALADFGATWCVPCRKMNPLIKRLEKKYRGQIRIIHVDIATSPILANHLMVHSIPTLIFFNNGRETDRIIGLHPEEAIHRHVTAVLTGNI